MGYEMDYFTSEIVQKAVIKRVIIPALACISGFFIPNIQIYSLKNVTITDVNLRLNNLNRRLIPLW
jgi:hypothetical protein